MNSEKMPAFHSIRPLWLPGLLLLAMTCRSDDTKAPDDGLPQPLDMSFSQPLLENSPFTRAINLTETLQLTGVAFIDGKPVVTVRDRETKKSHLITDESNAQGWRLAGVTAGSGAKGRPEARIEVGQEVITLQYAEIDYAAASRSGSSSGRYMPSKIPTPEEFTGRDEKGPYVRGMPYLSDKDREKMRDVPRDVRDKFLQVVHDERDKLFKASHEDRAAFVKKAYDATIRR